jgi:hypothetical protein
MRRLDVELRVSLRSLLHTNRGFPATIAAEGITSRIDATAAVRLSQGGLALTIHGTLDDGRRLGLDVRTDLRRPSSRSLSEFSGELSLGPPNPTTFRALLRADVFHGFLK